MIMEILVNSSWMEPLENKYMNDIIGFTLYIAVLEKGNKGTFCLLVFITISH